MAPFRSSRSTRNNDPATLNRGRGGVIDHDPTEGLPVRNWYLGNINIKQDESATNEDDQQPSANTINPDYPWPELPLPSFFSELPPLSQQLVRIARSGRPVKPSVYDKKTGTYISHAEYATRNMLKSKHLENVASPAAEDDDEMDEDLDVKAEMEKQERAFVLKKWAQVPPAVADKRPEPKYLADRRPGMRSLYGFQAAALNPAFNLNVAGAANTNGFDLGEGSGLGNATGVLAAGSDKPPVAVTPVKRMPPKRKKKGGPGRKKMNLGPGPSNANVPAGVDGVSINNAIAQGDGSEALKKNDIKTEGDSQMEDARDGEDEKGDDGSGSDEEGSEEGEIEEGQPQDSDVHLEDVVAAPATELPPMEATPAVVTTTDTTEPDEALAAETEQSAVEVVESAEPATIPILRIAEPVHEPGLVHEPEPVVEAVHLQEGRGSTSQVDFLGSLDNAVADMEAKEE